MVSLQSQSRILVIGGGGFIGSHLLPVLIKTGRDVVSLNRTPVGSERSVSGVHYVCGDYGDKEVLFKLLQSCDEVIHLAYATQPNTSFQNPFSDLAQNVPSTIQLFELAAEFKVRVLFVSSGGTVYGDMQRDFITEDHPTNPISPYGVTKLTLEKYAHMYAVTHALDVVIARPSNPYGEGQMPFVGQGFVATALATVLQGKPVTIFGESGTIRDYLYIADLIDGIITVLDKGETRGIYNIGSEVGLNNFQVVSEFQPLLNKLDIQVDILYALERPFDVKSNVLDCKKLKALGWQPKIGINEGLERTLVWLQKVLKNHG